MSVVIEGPPARARVLPEGGEDHGGRATPPPSGRQAARLRFPARRAGVDWPGTGQSREQVLDRLGSAPFVLDKTSSQKLRSSGLRSLLGWLEQQPGSTWQQRWFASGADAAGAGWRQAPGRWLHERGHTAGWRGDGLSAALVLAISADVVRPSLRWLVASRTGHGGLVRNLARTRDPEGFTRLRGLCDDAVDVSVGTARLTLHRTAVIIAAKGGTLGEITVGDVLELLDAEAAAHGRGSGGVTVFYRTLHRMGVFDEAAPASLRELRTSGQRSCAELIDRYQLCCRPIRDLLVGYLRERQPALDYTSLDSLAFYLGKRFWADIEAHHRGIDSLALPTAVADGWKRRLRTKITTVRTGDGRAGELTAPRINYRECLTPVRAFYLDLAHWAVEDPARWARWVAPCPVGAEEINRRKANRHHKSRIDARTRERLPVLPLLVAATAERRTTTQALLAAARRTPPGGAFDTAGHRLIRPLTPHAVADKVWAHDPSTGKRRDLGLDEDLAFWTWAVVEVLRATGVRIEELLEISHHSLVQYRLPTTGELVPLLQIAPSKTDAERLLVISPELAEVLAATIHRIRDTSGAVPLVRAYDPYERLWAPPAPLLFQRRFGAEHRRINPSVVRSMLSTALTHTGLLDTQGHALRYTPHDFRRMFITDAILNGLPPHIAQVIAGHRDINVTLGYKAVYPDEAIQSHLAFLARRRSLRPSEEYRSPTDEEWQAFLGHFERRKVSSGTCARAFGTPCIHEHACLRCSMLWPDPAQRSRLVEIRHNLIARIAEAEHEGWLGEVEGLQISLAGAEDKITQIDRRSTNPIPVDLAIPTAVNAAEPPERDTTTLPTTRDPRAAHAQEPNSAPPTVSP